MICPLCQFEFDERELACHSACALAGGCAIVCCPNCGYQQVDESKLGITQWLRRLLEPRPAEATQEPRE